MQSIGIPVVLSKVYYIVFFSYHELLNIVFINIFQHLKRDEYGSIGKEGGFAKSNILVYHIYMACPPSQPNVEFLTIPCDFFSFAIEQHTKS